MPPGSCDVPVEPELCWTPDAGSFGWETGILCFGREGARAGCGRGWFLVGREENAEYAELEEEDDAAPIVASFVGDCDREVFAT